MTDRFPETLHDSDFRNLARVISACTPGALGVCGGSADWDLFVFMSVMRNATRAGLIFSVLAATAPSADARGGHGHGMHSIGGHWHARRCSRRSRRWRSPSRQPRAASAVTHNSLRRRSSRG
jgi:hypothetical protein